MPIRIFISHAHADADIASSIIDLMIRAFNLPTNKDRLCERSEPQSYPVVGQARHGKQGSYI